MAITGTFVAGEEQNFNDVKVEIDQTPAASSFIDITSWVSNIQVTHGAVPTTQFNTYTVPINYIGEQDASTVVLTIVYTEDALTDPWREIIDDFNASPGLLYDVQWEPAGAGIGNYIYTTSGGRMTNVTYPTQPAGDGAPVTFDVTIVCSTITVSTQAV